MATEQQNLGESSGLGHWETGQGHNGCSDDQLYEKPYHVRYEDGALGMSGQGAEGPRRRSSVKRSRPGYRLGRSLSSRKKKKVIWDVTESIDYMPFNNKVTLHSREEASGGQRHFYGFSGRTLATLVATLVTGVIIGITGKVLEAGIDRGVAARNRVLASLMSENELAGQGFMVGLSMTSVALAAAAVQYLAPGAAGSGVSLVMALLNGNDIAGLLTPMVFVVKLFGTIMVRVSSLALGPEAPMVHLGACVASLVFNAGQRIVDFGHLEKQDDDMLQGIKDPVFSNTSLRQLISAGAAAGMAAAFGAPVGGVLFALEEACSVWSKKTAWRCLLSTAIAVFVMSQLWTSLGGGYILSFSGIYPLSDRQWLFQLPFVILVSAVGGFLGAFFNLMRRGMQRHRVSRRKHLLRMLEAGMVAAVTVVAFLAAPKFLGTCLDVPPTWRYEDVMQYGCPAGQYNDLATSLLISAPVIIRSFLGLGSESEPINRICTISMPCYYSLTSLFSVTMIYLAFMVLSSGLAVPGGLFMPSVMVGGSFGAFVGIALNPMVPQSWDIQPGVYAVVGAAATLAAVFRSSVSLVVILVEGTRGINFLPGILVAVIISNFIAHWVHPDGVYESELEADGRVFFLRQEPPGRLRNSTAEKLMATPVVGLNEVESVARVLQVLSSTTHNGFPVYPSPDGHLDFSLNPAEYSSLQGFVLRSQLLILIAEKAFCDVYGNYLDCDSPTEEYESRLNALMHHATQGGGLIVNALIDSEDEDPEEENEEFSPKLPKVMSRAMQIMDELNANESFADLLVAQEAGSGITPDLGQQPSRSKYGSFTHKSILTDIYVNMKPFMDQGMITVRPDTPAAYVHQMFVSMSLRHLCVVDASSRVLGIITRKDLDRAAGHGWWRSNKMAPLPKMDTEVLRSTSWFASSLQSIAMPPRRLFSDFMQRFSPSPASHGSILRASQESADDESAIQRPLVNSANHPSLEHLLQMTEEDAAAEELEN